MVERLVRNEKVWGSNPHTSTMSPEKTYEDRGTDVQRGYLARGGVRRRELRGLHKLDIADFNKCPAAGRTGVLCEQMSRGWGDFRAVPTKKRWEAGSDFAGEF